MSDQNAVQREATKDFYIKWLTERFTEPVVERGMIVRYECTLSKEQIEEMAGTYAVQQNPLPRIPEIER